MQSRCPQCGKQVEYSSRNKWRPFCSERCKLIDLGDWIEEKNRIPDEPADITADSTDDSDHFTH